MDLLERFKQIEYDRPDEIEAKSMAIIESEVDLSQIDPYVKPLVLRAIHTSADFSYAENLYVSPGAVQLAIESIRQGAHFITDTRMAFSGINRTLLSKWSGDVHCYMTDQDVAKKAKQRGCTRATICMEKGMCLTEQLKKPLIFAIGNAPTALIRLAQGIHEENWRPSLIIGAPVGFVNVIEAKEFIKTIYELYNVPVIVSMGRKGGSNIAAALSNALIYMASGKIQV